MTEQPEIQCSAMNESELSIHVRNRAYWIRDVKPNPKNVTSITSGEADAEQSRKTPSPAKTAAMDESELSMHVRNRTYWIRDVKSNPKNVTSITSGEADAEQSRKTPPPAKTAAMDESELSMHMRNRAYWIRDVNLNPKDNTSITSGEADAEQPRKTPPPAKTAAMDKSNLPMHARNRAHWIRDVESKSEMLRPKDVTSNTSAISSMGDESQVVLSELHLLHFLGNVNPCGRLGHTR